jgi:hypothetical protein
LPAFHNELLSQSHWNPGDDLGRIKVVIAEGFARDNPTYPFERKKNIVSFSFQHAPLGEFASNKAQDSGCLYNYWSILRTSIQMCWKHLLLLGQMPPCGVKSLSLRLISYSRLHQGRCMMELKPTGIHRDGDLVLQDRCHQLSIWAFLALRMVQPFYRHLSSTPS